MMKNNFEKIVGCTPAFDKRSPVPSKDYGIHGVNINFILKGKLGAVQFVIFTNWQLPEVSKEHWSKYSNEPSMLKSLLEPLPADVGYHSYKPMWKGQAPVTESCEYLEGKPCYYDGSGLEAERVFKEIFLRQGSDGIWKYLEETYNERFLVEVEDE